MTRHLRTWDWVRKGSHSVTFSDVLYYIYLTITNFTMCLKCCSSARQTGRGAARKLSHMKCQKTKGMKSPTFFSLGIKLPGTFFVSYKRATELCKGWTYAFNHIFSSWLYLAGLAGSYTGKTSSYRSNLPESKLQDFIMVKGVMLLYLKGKDFLKICSPMLEFLD